MKVFHKLFAMKKELPQKLNSVLPTELKKKKVRELNNLLTSIFIYLFKKHLLCAIPGRYTKELQRKMGILLHSLQF